MELRDRLLADLLDSDRALNGLGAGDCYLMTWSPTPPVLGLPHNERAEKPTEERERDHRDDDAGGHH
jgi:hypothetical protein